MDKTSVDNEKTFENLVNQYSNWLESIEDPKTQLIRKLKSFFRYMGSAIDLSGQITSIDYNKLNHPIYNRKDLSSQQKNAIIMATTYKKIGDSIDELVSDDDLPPFMSKEMAKECKKNAADMYKDYKEIFISGYLA